MKICLICKVSKPESEFYKNGYTPFRPGREKKTRSECKECGNARHKEYFEAKRDEINAKRKAKYHAGDKRQAIASNLKRYYKISLDDYERMFASQDGFCKICGIHQNEMPRRFDVDHCHVTGKIRGLLCIKCNRGLGLFQDSVKNLESAIRHL